MKMLLILNDPLYGSERSDNGPRLARVASVSAADIEGQAPGDFTTG